VVAASFGRHPSAALVATAVGDDRETILLQLVAEEAGLTDAALALSGLHRGDGARTAAFVTADWTDDVGRFARGHDASLVLVDAVLDALPEPLLRQSPADVGLVFGGEAGLRDGAIYVPFGGGEHDWAALELAALLARSRERPLRLVGTGAAPGGRDASRLLADASLAVQRAFEVASAPVLAPAAPDALLAVVGDAAAVVAGIGSRWRSAGLDGIRRALAAEATPAILVHRGPRPGVLAPRESRTRYTWSLQD
jgi:hypothetical protein